MITIAIIALVLALVPCGLFLSNLSQYRPPALPTGRSLPAVSVLIPARNEEANIAGALQSVFGNAGVEFEVVVLDDHSSDRTAAIVDEFTNLHPSVRLETSPALPPGWCGKQHACTALAERARFPLLVFMDADVRLAPDALARMAAFVVDQDVALASGVPRQVLGTFWEKMLIPLIQFVLLGFLPMSRMRRSTAPAYAAGCGQLFIAKADAYRACGGHAAIRASLHDGIKLPKAFREHGFKTDLFDATGLARCRMYRGAREVFAGLAKNATEGLAAPARIVPVTALLFLGQVLPWLLTLVAEGEAYAVSVVGAMITLVPRVASCWRFRQPLVTALLHPFAILVLLGIQWTALFRAWRGKPSTWRGRAYAKVAAGVLLIAAVSFTEASTNQTDRIGTFELQDQHGATRRYEFPRTNVTFLVVADHKGSEQLEPWIRSVYERFAGRVAIEGVADVSTVPAGLRGLVKRAFVKQLDYPVMLDWKGEVARQFRPEKDVANVFVLSRQGAVVLRLAGRADAPRMRRVYEAIESELRRLSQ